MAQNESSVPRRGRWLKRLVWAGAILVVVVVTLYFIATSNMFFKGVLLPQIGHALNADVSVSSAEISPFSKVVLHDLKVTPKGAEPIFAATTVTARYNLMAILRGHIVVDEASVASPTVTVVENADGTSNLTPLEKSEKPKAEPKPAKATPPASPPAVDIKSVRLENATVRYVKNFKGGGRETIELTQVNFTVANIKNGTTGTLEFSAAIALDKLVGAASDGAMQAKLNGSFTINFTTDLKPTAITGTAAFNIDKATGGFSELATLGAKLECNVTPTEIRQCDLAFTKAAIGQGNVRVSGPFDSSTIEGKLKVEILAIDRQVLNLVGDQMGIDFGTTAINASNTIELTKGGTIITANGSLTVAHLQFIRQRQSSPTLDLQCDYSVAVDQQTQTATIKALHMTGVQKKRNLVQMELASPMTIAWGNANNVVGDATLNLAVTDLNLADWKPLTGESGPVGIANVKSKLLSQQGGQQLQFDLDGRVEHLSARVNQDQLAPLDVRLRVNGNVAGLQHLTVSEYHLDLAQESQSVMAMSGNATVDLQTQATDAQVAIKVALTRLATLLPQKDFTCRAGQLELTSHVTSTQQTQVVVGQLALTDFTGRYGEYQFDHFGTTFDLDVLMKGNQLQIRKAAGQLREGSNGGGRFDVSGNCDSSKTSGQFAVKLVDFKENDLRPFLQPSLGGKQLTSVSLNTTATTEFNGIGAMTVKADLRVANLVVQDPTNQVPVTPLEARVQIDATANHSVLTMRQCQLTLTPTARANNELRLTGTVDYTKTTAITGNLKLAATALDVTPYYDLFAGTNTAHETTASTEPAKTPAQPATKPAVVEAKEPDAITLPVRDFTFAVAIDRCYLREVDLVNLQTTAKLDGGHIVVKPCQLVLNGGSINASVDMDLGVPGYKYDILFSADKIPLAPLADSFSPTYKDSAKGMLTAHIQIQGAGTTGRNLRKTLAGETTLVLTNANIEIVGAKVKAVLTPISRLLGAPELLSSPLDYVEADLHFGDGQIETRKFTAYSAAVLAESTGTIPIADVLTDSPLSQPIDLSLSKQLSKRLHPNTPSEEGYSKLPRLVHLAGTLGDPTAKTVVGDAAGTVVDTLGKTAGTVKQGIGKFFSGQSSTNSSSSSTNSSHSPFNIFHHSSE